MYVWFVHKVFHELLFEILNPIVLYLCNKTTIHLYEHLYVISMMYESLHNGKVLSILLNNMCKLDRGVLLLQVLAGHEGPISGLVFSSSQPLLVSGSWDKTVRLWNMFDSKVTWETLNVGSEGLLICLLFILLKVIMLLCIQHRVETESDINQPPGVSSLLSKRFQAMVSAIGNLDSTSFPLNKMLSRGYTPAGDLFTL